MAASSGATSETHTRRSSARQSATLAGATAIHHRYHCFTPQHHGTTPWPHLQLKTCKLKTYKLVITIVLGIDANLPDVL